MMYSKNVQKQDQKIFKCISRNFVLIFIFLQVHDTLLDWMLGFLDHATGGIHTIVEAFEYSFEVILGYALHTNHHQSEIIIVNAAIIFGLCFTYRFIKALPKLYNRLTNNLRQYNERQSSSWKAMPLIRKIKWITGYCIATYCLFFLVTEVT